MEKIEIVVRNIINKCGEANVACSEYLAAFVAHTIVRANSVSFALNKEICEDGLQEVTQRSVQKIIEEDSPAMDTIKMQVAYNVARMLCDNEKRNKDKRKFDVCEHKTLALVKKIPQGCIDDKHCFLDLYDDIFVYIREQQNDENDVLKVMQQRADEEISAAIESVFPPVGLKSFLLLSVEEKKASLHELSHLVLGIRLFNREYRNSKTGLISIEKIHEEQVLVLKQRLKSAIQTVNEKCDFYHESISLAKVGRKKSNEKQILRWKDELTNRRQFMTFLRNILHEINILANHFTAIKDEFHASLDYLKTFIANKKTIPKKHIFPKFKRVAQLWKDMLNYHEDTQFIRYRFNDVLRHEKTFDETIDIPHLNGEKNKRKNIEKSGYFIHAAKDNCVEQVKQTKKLEGGNEIKEGEKFALSQENNVFEYPNDDKNKPVHLSSSTISTNFINLELEYNGYCPSSITKHNGLLLFGKPELGLVHYRDKNYAFENKNCLNVFLENPRSIIEGVSKIATMNPELIHALRLQNEFMPQTFTALIKNAFHYTPSHIVNQSKMVCILQIEDDVVLSFSDTKNFKQIINILLGCIYRNPFTFQRIFY